MSNIFRSLMGILLSALLLTSCQATTEDRRANVDDGAITTRVNAALVTDKPSYFTRIDVDTNNGVVTLNGIVDSPEQRARAEQLASRVDGVKRVINNLQVKSARP
jgi:hyperosmotically inducible periplasmic protein